DRVVDDARVPAEHAAVDVHDVTGLSGAGLQPLDDVGVVPLRNEADVLAVRLVGHRQRKPPGQHPHLRLAIAAERKAEPGELLARGGEQEVALVALGVAGAIELGPRRPLAQGDVVPGGERIGLELARRLEQLVELDLLVADHAWDRGLAGHVALGERLHDGRSEALLVVEHIVGDAEPVGDAARIMDVLAGTARAAPSDGLAVIVELKGDAYDVVALLLEQRRGHGGVDAAGHGHYHPPGAGGGMPHGGGILQSGHRRQSVDSQLTRRPALCPSPSAAAIWWHDWAQSRRNRGKPLPLRCAAAGAPRQAETSYRAYRTGTREAEGGIRDTPIGEVPLEFTKTP